MFKHGEFTLMTQFWHKETFSGKTFESICMAPADKKYVTGSYIAPADGPKRQWLTLAAVVFKFFTTGLTLCFVERLIWKFQKRTQKQCTKKQRSKMQIYPAAHQNTYDSLRLQLIFLGGC